MFRTTTILGWMILLAALVQPIFAEETPLATGDLLVLGASLEVAPAEMTVPVGIPSQVQTVFSAAQATPPAGMLARATLTGPGLNGAVQLTTLPGHPFTLPGMPVSGTYSLDDIRIVKESRESLVDEIADEALPWR